MFNPQLSTLSDIATATQTAIQQDFTNIDPIVGVNQSMRSSGVPADIITIDCLSSGKRIILILHDEQPGIINYQLSFKDKDPQGKFETIPFEELTKNTLYQWIHQYFLGTED
ncbi:hypothetical protein A9Q99_15035 [Gammaproteobacteria bacterium 45_16_T64]|nr:hypothetical protein A9Q99_15035 [Gammaproteobacteria bacterium 45_16_T64]